MMTVLDFTCWSWVVDIGIFSEFDDFMKIDCFQSGHTAQEWGSNGLTKWVVSISSFETSQSFVISRCRTALI